MAVTLQSTGISGANLTLLLSQLKQDVSILGCTIIIDHYYYCYQYMSGSLVIRYNGLVLEPTGTFQINQQMPTSQTSGLLWWHYLLICASGLLLFLCTVTVVVSTSSLARDGTYIVWSIYILGHTSGDDEEQNKISCASCASC